MYLKGRQRLGQTGRQKGIMCVYLCGGRKEAGGGKQLPANRWAKNKGAKNT